MKATTTILLLFARACLHGIIITAVGSLLGLGAGAIFGADLPEECANWNENYVMEVTLFMTGFVTYLVIELAKWSYVELKIG